MTPEKPVPPTNPRESPILASSSIAGESIESDIPCRQCGYNLRGLRETMACPECGIAVGLSTRGDFLRYADPKWVETIARGSTIIVWSILAQFVAAVLGVWAELATGNTTILALLTLAVSLITAVGVWKLTTRDTGQARRDRFSQAREIARMTLLITIGASILLVASAWLPASTDRDLLVILLSLMAGLVSAISAYFLYLYIQHLATRVPDDLLTRRAAFLRIAFVATSVPAQLLDGFTKFYTFGQANPTNPTLIEALRIAGALLGIVAFAWAIVSIFFLLRFTRRLREQAQSARRTWAAQAAVATPA